MSFRLIVMAVLALAAGPSGVRGAERIVLKDGTFLEGDVASEDAKKIVLNTWKGKVEVDAGQIAGRSLVADGSDRLRIMRVRGRDEAAQPYVPRPGDRREGDGGVEIRVARSKSDPGRDAMRVVGSVDAPGTTGPVVVRGGAAAVGEARVVGVGGAVTQAPAAANWRDRIVRQLERKMTLDLSDDTLDNAMTLLGAMTDVTIILDPKIQAGQKRVTLTVRDMDAGNVVSWLTKLTDTAPVLKDKALFITSPETAKKEEEAEAPIEIPRREEKDPEENLKDFPAPCVLGIDQPGAGGALMPRQ